MVIKLILLRISNFVALNIKKFLSKRYPREVAKAIFMGSTYGGKSLVFDDRLKGGFVVCAGAGEDISFDLELASTYESICVIVDPTPRSINHFNSVKNRVGKNSQVSYVDGGKQPPEAYDLTKIREGQLHLISKALWDSASFLKFYPPVNLEHVSYSLQNIQKIKNTNDVLEVPTITILEIMHNFQAKEIALLKLDIEGAAYRVCKNIFKNGVFPHQLLIEFDELIFPSFKNNLTSLKLLWLLYINNYKIVASTSDVEYSFRKEKNE